ncbi:MAG TPA: hypothetical protein VJY42_01695 [Candidatus Methanomethylophilaceae archaeon]|nr:hypothetical protein [Candidatus Methanomethylophilaceae archaeon]
MREEDIRVVRDLDPGIMEGEGYAGTFHKSDHTERYDLLTRRLIDDVEVFARTNDPDVMLDLIEVAYALSSLMGYAEEEMVRMRKAVKKERGNYSRGTIFVPE